MLFKRWIWIFVVLIPFVGVFADTPMRTYQDATGQQTNDIRKIVVYLSKASNSMVGRGLRALGDIPEVVELKKAGDRIRDVHPLVMLKTIFQDEEIKVAFRSMRKKGWSWAQFFPELSRSFDLEAGRGNLTDAMIDDFANAFELKRSLINPYIEAKRWEAFCDVLIDVIPRKGEYDYFNF